MHPDGEYPAKQVSAAAAERVIRLKVYAAIVTITCVLALFLGTSLGDSSFNFFGVPLDVPLAEMISNRALQARHFAYKLKQLDTARGVTEDTLVMHINHDTTDRIDYVEQNPHKGMLGKSVLVVGGDPLRLEKFGREKRSVTQK